jgi:uncharacterized membrane protein HdeD (DUF308 family)
MKGTLLSSLAKNWWVLLLRGIVSILFGVLAFVMPGLTLFTLIIMYGVYAAADGVLALVAAFQGGTMAPRWWLALVGVLGLLAAAATFFYPQVTAIILIMFIGVWAIAHGILEIVGAIQLRKEIDNEWLLALGGALSIIFGVFVAVQPGAGALALVWLIGAYSIAFGIVLVAFSLRLRRRIAAHAPPAALRPS